MKCDFHGFWSIAVLLSSTAWTYKCMFCDVEPYSKVYKEDSMSQKLEVWFLEMKKIFLPDAEEAVRLPLLNGKGIFRKVTSSTCDLLTNVWKNISFLWFAGRCLEKCILLFQKHSICNMMNWVWIIFVYCSNDLCRNGEKLLIRYSTDANSFSVF